MGNCLKKKKKQEEEFVQEPERIVDKSPKPVLGGQNVTLINSIVKWEEKLSEADRDNKMTVVNFGASWCTPCRVISPAFAELAVKYSSMMCLAVNVDELAEFSTSWDIKATPTFIFLKNGREVDRFVGANKEDLQRKIAAIAGSLTSSRS